ncbi:MAG: dienelactone hydrolase family protein [Bryobacteraceae bacterium]
MRHSAAVPFEAEYLLHEPERAADGTLLVLALHGYGSNPEAMLRLSEIALGGDAIIASLRGPNQYYLSEGSLGTPAPGSQIGYNWGTTPHAAINIKLHHAIVRAISAELRARFQVPAKHVVLMGFSQPVGLNYRFIGTHPEEAGGVIAMCGGVPKDWEADKYARVDAPILHIARSEDEFFPEAVARGFPDRLRAHAPNVEFHMLPGKHRFPSKAGALIREFTEKIKAS